MVKTNFYEVKIDNYDTEVFQYDCDIRDAIKLRKKDPATGKFIEPWEHYYELKRRGKEMDMEKAGMLSRRILQKLQQQNVGTLLAYDGSKTVYSSKRLFTAETATESKMGAGTSEEGKSQQGRYGPADSGGFDAPAARDTLRSDYFVSVKKDCDENDEESDRVKTAHFCVRLTEVAVLPLRHVLEMRDREVQNADVLRHAMDVMLKTACFSFMYAPGKSPRRFYFPEDQQDQILSRVHQVYRDFTNRNASIAPFVGITQAMRFCAGGNVFVNADSCVNFFDRDHYYDRNQPGRKIPLLDTERRTIAGVPVNVNEPIRDRNTQDAVENAIKKLMFHVKYEKTPNPTWVAKCRERGKNDAWIRRKCTEVRRNCHMKLDRDHDNKGIIWSCNDPAVHSFVCEPRKPKKRDDETDEQYQAILDRLPAPVTHTLYSYYREKKGITLRFPNMPAVFIGKNEWFPIEFLTQAFGKSKDANSAAQVNTILKYYDEFAGTRCVDNVTDLMNRMFGEMSRTGVDVLRQFSLRKSEEPVELRAKVLATPALEFQNNVPASLRNGSWDLRDKRFAKPSDLGAFAVIDSGRGESRYYMENLFKVMGRHSMELPLGAENALRAVTTEADLTRGPQAVYDAFDEALKKAKGFFWYDSSNEFRNKHSFFKTRIKNEDGQTEECLLLPPYLANGGLGAILPYSVYAPTHVVQTEQGNKEARIMVVIDKSREPIDPFHYRNNNGREEAQDPNSGAWSPCHFLKHVFRFQDGTSLDENQVAPNPTPFIPLEEWQIDMPFVFVYLSSDNTQVYHQVKMMSHFQFGAPSQCAVHNKFRGQKNPDQYCSNIALKCNTKLMNKWNQGRAWNTFHISNGQKIEGIPWINEAPTMVIGIDASHGLGQDSISVIAGSVGLDPGCMQLAQALRIQSKSPRICKTVMKSIVKTLYYHFCQHNGVSPVRVLVYRDGSSEGEFERILSHEVASIREALYELNSAKPEFECPNAAKCQGKGCVFCTPPITFVISQSQHSIRIVPKVEPMHRDKNVSSGTCVDSIIMDMKDGMNFAVKDVPREPIPGCNNVKLFADTNEVGYDFLLTSQGGLKGTSKPIYYRVLLNENAVWKASESCTPLTKEMLQTCTYYQSYQYGTATKAVRGIPLIYYSGRLANTGMGYVNYLRGRKEGLHVENGEYPLIDPVDERSEGDEELPTGRDGQPMERHVIVRRDLWNLENIPPEMKTELLPKFSPFDKDVTQSLTSPFRPHLSA